jgi:hypothetical protein
MKLLPFLLLLVISVSFTEFAKAGSKVDTIFFQNGNKLTGEVKTLRNNELKVSTDDAGTISIQWDHVDSIIVLNSMRITLENGEILFGNIYPSGKLKECAIHEDGGNIREEKMENIVEMMQAEKNFADRLSGLVGAGLSYTKASEVMQMDFSGNLQYTAEKNIYEIYYNLVYTDEKESGNTQRQNGGASYQRVLPRKWFLEGTVKAESNSEFDLDLRTTLGMGAGNNIIQNTTQRLYTGAGFMVNRENSLGENQDNIEGVVLLNYSVFIFDSPELILNFSGNLIPSFNRWGRLRSEIDTNLKWEVFSDFYIKGTFYNSFDNQPPSGTDVRSDWGFTFGLEYSI